MFIALSGTFIHETSLTLLDMLLLSSFTNDFSPKHKHWFATGTKDGKSFRTLQVKD